MTAEAWERTIAEHPLESQDPKAWLRYAVALLERIEPQTPERRLLLLPAALAFLEAQRCGASQEAVAAAQRSAALRQLFNALRLAGVDSVGSKV